MAYIRFACCPIQLAFEYYNSVKILIKHIQYKCTLNNNNYTFHFKV